MTGAPQLILQWAWDVNSLEPYIQGQVAYLDNAISWARQYGLKVMLDLHGGE
jgi:aryl-phospho-beta-D-glucosidase BglC (GH1 family)